MQNILNMSRKTYEACNAPKRIVTIPKAGHGLVYVVDNDLYFKSVAEFFTQNSVPKISKETNEIKE